MKYRILFHRLFALALVAACLSLTARTSQAVEETERFLLGLRDRGMFDTALMYLDEMQDSNLVSPSFKETIDFEAGLILINAAQVSRSPSQGEKYLAAAEKRFEKFVKEHANHPKALGATTQLANVLSERAALKVRSADRPSVTADEKKNILGEARELYLEAGKIIDKGTERLLAELQKYKLVDKSDTKAVERRDQVRKDLLQSRLALPTIYYEISKTHESGSAESKAALKKAAEEYASVYEKYDAYLAGLYARMYEGRCYKDMGEHKKASEVFTELAELPDSPPAYRDLKNKVKAFSLENSLLGGKKEDLAAVADEAAQWLKKARADEESGPEGLAIKFYGGKAALEHARALPKNDRTRSGFLRTAKKNLVEVSRVPGELKQDAQAALADPLLAGNDAEPEEPTNFTEATERAKLAIDRMTALDVQLRTEQDAAKRQTLSTQRDEARAEAQKYYLLALDLADAETTDDQKNVARYYLCYIDWLNGRLYDAAVRGEFLARNYPSSIGGKPGAQIAMAAYAILYNDVPSNQDNSFELNHMKSIAEFITTQWPTSSEAEDAWIMLVRTAVLSRDLETAQKYLEKIPAASAKRGQAELMTGQALWGAYLQAAKLPEEQRPSQEELDKMVAEAQNTLEAGIGRMKKAVDDGGDLDYPLVASVLSLAQISIMAGDAEKAVKWLEDPTVGALSLVDKRSPITDSGNFRVETYKAALRAYVATQDVDKAEKAMESLEALIAESGAADTGALTKIYISLGRSLQKQLELLREQNKQDELADISRGFELFLDRIAKSSKGVNFNSLNWVAETYAGMGAGFQSGEKAKAYYGKAAGTYEDILEKLKKDPSFGPKGALISIQIRLAKCLRNQGEFQKSRDVLIEVLKEKETMIDAQVQAAYTYQAWGEENSTNYDFAIKGSTKFKEIWGWGKIAARAVRSSNPKYKALFFEARYNLALSRMNKGLASTGTTRKETLEQAEADIVRVAQLYPEMGGKVWWEKYDSLLKNIQKLLGKKAVGLSR